MMIRCAWVGTNKMADGWTGVVEVGGVVAAVGVNLGNVGLTQMWGQKWQT